LLTLSQVYVATAFWRERHRSDPVDSRADGRTKSALAVAQYVCLGIVLIAVGVGVRGCRSAGILDYGDNIDLREIASSVGFSFPPSARLIHGVNSTFQDAQIDALVEMHQTDVEKFIKSALAARSTPGKDRVEVSETDRLSITNEWVGWDWWGPDSAQRFRAVSIDRAWRHGEILRILVDLDDPDRAKVYLSYAAD
jgi:hypothetical protein